MGCRKAAHSPPWAWVKITPSGSPLGVHLTRLRLWRRHRGRAEVGVVQHRVEHEARLLARVHHLMLEAVVEDHRSTLGVRAPLVTHSEAHALPALQRQLEHEAPVGHANVWQHVRTRRQPEDGHLALRRGYRAVGMVHLTRHLGRRPQQRAERRGTRAPLLHPRGAIEEHELRPHARAVAVSTRRGGYGRCARHDALEAASASTSASTSTFAAAAFPGSAADADAREILRDITRGPRLLEGRGDAEPGAIPPAARLQIWREHARRLLGAAPAGGRVRVRIAGGDEARRALCVAEASVHGDGRGELVVEARGLRLYGSVQLAAQRRRRERLEPPHRAAQLGGLGEQQEPPQLGGTPAIALAIALAALAALALAAAAAATALSVGQRQRRLELFHRRSQVAQRGAVVVARVLREGALPLHPMRGATPPAAERRVAARRVAATHCATLHWARRLEEAGGRRHVRRGLGVLHPQPPHGGRGDGGVGGDLGVGRLARGGAEPQHRRAQVDRHPRGATRAQVTSVVHAGRVARLCCRHEGGERGGRVARAHEQPLLRRREEPGQRLRLRGRLAAPDAERTPLAERHEVVGRVGMALRCGRAEPALAQLAVAR
eukprot:scaffold86386_cov75-Phaeocystis_antarctica.AAC.2